MPQLTWIGKEKVENHDKDLPFRVLKPNKKLSLGDDKNLLIQGDNLEALKALMPFYYGKVKCVYIDPPYNTGNEKWVYNDKVNSPSMKAWINKVVGAEGEDLCRHDKWLSMIYPRIKLLYQLLRDDGLIFISIDENEVANLKFVLDEIFGIQNKVSWIHWRRVEGKPGKAKYIGIVTENILVYAKDISKIKIKGVKLSEKALKEYRYSDEKGKFRRGQIYYPGRGQHHFSVKSKYGNEIEGDFTLSKENFIEMDKQGLIYWAEKGDHTPYSKVYLSDTLIRTPSNDWGTEFGSNQQATKELKLIFGGIKKFDNPKPLKLIKTIIQIASNENDIILDSFAGSGTTGHAVLELNKEEKSNRKFILVELEKNIATSVTSERLTKTIKGYKGAKYPNGTGQGFTYLDLNGELFDKNGFINSVVNYEDLASYVFFTETNSYLDLNVIKKPYIGSMGTSDYFLLFEGKGKNVLDEYIYKTISKYKGKKIIFADKCLLDEDFCEKNNIIFKQIPYELKKY